jgi:hypothetical protein
MISRKRAIKVPKAERGKERTVTRFRDQRHLIRFIVLETPNIKGARDSPSGRWPSIAIGALLTDLRRRRCPGIGLHRNNKHR